MANQWYELTTAAQEQVQIDRNVNLDRMTVTWNTQTEEVESDPVYYFNQDDYMNGLALALATCEIEWRDVTSFVVTSVKNVKVPLIPIQ